MTPTLETALAGLPAKPRVHELSKRIGISNKELLAALAARGLTITSASASVPQAVAQAVIQEMLGGPPVDDQPVDGEGTAEAPTATDADERAADGGSSDTQPAPETPDVPGDAFNPLFLPPAETQREPAGSEQSEDAEEPAPAKSGGRRRRGRSGGRRPAQDAAVDAEAEAEAEAPDPRALVKSTRVRKATPAMQTRRRMPPPTTPPKPPDSPDQTTPTTPTTTRPRAAGGGAAVVAAAAGWPIPTSATTSRTSRRPSPHRARQPRNQRPAVQTRRVRNQPRTPSPRTIRALIARPRPTPAPAARPGTAVAVVVVAGQPVTRRPANSLKKRDPTETITLMGKTATCSSRISNHMYSFFIKTGARVTGFIEEAGVSVSSASPRELRELINSGEFAEQTHLGVLALAVIKGFLTF